MKTVQVVKMEKGYYVTKLWYGRNKGSEWCKTLKQVNAIKKAWIGK